eukprot:Skav231309  [mRNA]  locus=scaffold1116:13180:20382:- [translate_table: standard]
MNECLKNEKRLYLTPEQKSTAVRDSAAAAVWEGAKSGGIMLVQEKAGAVLRECCPAASSLLGSSLACVNALPAGMPVPSRIIVESNRVGVGFTGGHLLSAGQRQSTGESKTGGSRVSAHQVESGMQYRIGEPGTAGILGVHGNVGVTERTTHTVSDSGSRVATTSETLAGVTCRPDVFGIDVGLHLDTGLARSHTLHENKGWLSSNNTETHRAAVKVLGADVAKHEVNVDHTSREASEVTTYGPDRFAILEVERSGTLVPNWKHGGLPYHTMQWETTTYKVGEGGHMLVGSGASGMVQGACDLLDGKSFGEAICDGGSTIEQNLKDVGIMKLTGVPIIHLDSEHAEVILPDGLSIGSGHTTESLHVPEGNLQQETQGLEIGVGIPGDPVGVIQARAALGHTVDKVCKEVNGPDGSQKRHQATYETSGVELQLSLGNRALGPLQLGCVNENSVDTSRAEHDGVKTEAEEVQTKHGLDLGLLFAKHVDSNTTTMTTSAEAGVSTEHEAFQGEEVGIRLGILNHSNASGHFETDVSCPDHSWTSQDGVEHHESLQEHFNGVETRDHTTACFGIFDCGTSVSQTGEMISEKHSGTLSHGLKDGQTIDAQREEVTLCEGTKQTHNGSICSEDLAVHKSVQEHREIDARKEDATTIDIQRKFDGHGDSAHSHLHGSADPLSSDVEGSESHTFSSDSFHIHNGEGQYHFESWLFSTSVSGKMHWDENSSKVIMDDPNTSQVTLSAPVNCAIGAVASSALQLVASKGYLSSRDAFSLCATGALQYGLFKAVEFLAIKLGSKWPTLGAAIAIYAAVMELVNTYRNPSLSIGTKYGHSFLALFSAGGTLFLYFFCACNPLLSVFVASARFGQDVLKNAIDWLCGNLDWHFALENTLRSPSLGAAGAGFLGAQAGLRLGGLLLGPLGMGLGAAIGGAVCSIVGSLTWRSIADWLCGRPAIPSQLQYAYTFLEVQPGASHQEVRESFRRKALKFHPDKPGGSDEQFKLLKAHYDVIMDLVVSGMDEHSSESECMSKRSSTETRLLDGIGGAAAVANRDFKAPEVRCAATAACETAEVPGATGDTAVEVLAALHRDGWDLELSEVEEVIRVWNLNAYDNALAPVACKARWEDPSDDVGNLGG